MAKRCWNAYVVTMFDTLNNVTPSPMPTVWNHKRSLNIIARKKSFQGEQNGAFLLFVMLVFKVLPEVQQLNYTILVVS
jgi:hypothetical protein